VANAVVIGFETDYPGLSCWDPIENAFLIVFTLELAFRILCIGPVKFLSPMDPDFTWNVFDLGIVSLGLFDIFSSMVLNTGGNSFATVFRMLRLLRILRVFKILRFLKQLYMLAYGFVEAAQAIAWVTLLMGGLLYICAVVLVRTVGRPSADKASSGDQLSEEHEFWASRFGTIVASMRTLFELMSQPDLTPYHDRLQNNIALTIFLVMFVIMGSFGMVALLTGVITEAMFEKNQARNEEERAERDQKRLKLAERLALLYDQAGLDAEQGSSWEEIEAITPLIEAVLQASEVEYKPEDLRPEVLDKDGDGSITKSEFVNKVLSIVDSQRLPNIIEIFQEVSHVQATLERLEEKLSSSELASQELRAQTTAATEAMATKLDEGLGELRAQLARLEPGGASSVVAAAAGRPPLAVVEAGRPQQQLPEAKSSSAPPLECDASKPGLEQQQQQPVAATPVRGTELLLGLSSPPPQQQQQQLPAGGSGAPPPELETLLARLSQDLACNLVRTVTEVLTRELPRPTSPGFEYATVSAEGSEASMQRFKHHDRPLRLPSVTTTIGTSATTTPTQQEEARLGTRAEVEPSFAGSPVVHPQQPHTVADFPGPSPSSTAERRVGEAANFSKEASSLGGMPSLAPPPGPQGRVGEAASGEAEVSPLAQPLLSEASSQAAQHQEEHQKPFQGELHAAKGWPPSPIQSSSTQSSSGAGQSRGG